MNIDKFNAKIKDVGGIPVTRLLPQSKRKTIGAWCFLDHAGPAEFAQYALGMQVGLHPHTNLQTFTWMLEGEVWHQDSSWTSSIDQAKTSQSNDCRHR
ncbi:pirin family protein [[Pasteurella] aerogenes]